MTSHYKITTFNGKPQSFTYDWIGNKPQKIKIESGAIYELSQTIAYAMKEQAFFDYPTQKRVLVFDLEEETE